MVWIYNDNFNHVQNMLEINQIPYMYINESDNVIGRPIQVIHKNKFDVSCMQISNGTNLMCYPVQVFYKNSPIINKFHKIGIYQVTFIKIILSMCDKKKEVNALRVYYNEK